MTWRWERGGETEKKRIISGDDEETSKNGKEERKGQLALICAIGKERINITACIPQEGEKESSERKKKKKEREREKKRRAARCRRWSGGKTKRLLVTRGQKGFRWKRGGGKKVYFLGQREGGEPNGSKHIEGEGGRVNDASNGFH